MTRHHGPGNFSDMPESDRLRLAALIDSNGQFYIQFENRFKLHTPLLNITGDLETLQYFADGYERSTISRRTWIIKRNAVLKNLLDVVINYLKIKRPQADLIFEAIAAKTRGDEDELKKLNFKLMRLKREQRAG